MGRWLVLLCVVCVAHGGDKEVPPTHSALHIIQSLVGAGGKNASEGPAPVRNLEQVPTVDLVGRAALGGIVGGMMGVVGGSQSLAISGADPELADAVGHFWGGMGGGAMASILLSNVDVLPGDSKPSMRVRFASMGFQNGLAAGAVIGSFSSIFSGSSDEGGSSASSGSSTLSSGEGAAGDGAHGDRPSPFAISAKVALLHNALAGGLGGAAAGYFLPEINQLGRETGLVVGDLAASTGDLASSSHKILKKGAGAIAEGRMDKLAKVGANAVLSSREAKESAKERAAKAREAVDETMSNGINAAGEGVELVHGMVNQRKVETALVRASKAYKPSNRPIPPAVDETHSMRVELCANRLWDSLTAGSYGHLMAVVSNKVSTISAIRDELLRPLGTDPDFFSPLLTKKRQQQRGLRTQGDFDRVYCLEGERCRCFVLAARVNHVLPAALQPVSIVARIERVLQEQAVETFNAAV